MWSTKSNPSIKSRLIKSLIGFSFLLFLIVSLVNYFAVVDEVEENYDGELTMIGHMLSAFFDHEYPEDNRDHPLVSDPVFRGEENYEEYYFFQALNPSGQLIARSSNAPEAPIALQKLGLTETQINNQTYRIYHHQSQTHQLKILVAQDLAIRQEIPGKIILVFFLYLIIGFPIMYFVLRWIINQGLSPLTALSKQITTRSSSNLEPLTTPFQAIELDSIISAMNQLFSRLKKAFEKERQFTEDAAHELRTPLAGLKAQSQIALLDKNRIEDSLKNIIHSVDHTSRLAEQLLSLSRLDRKAYTTPQAFHLNQLIDTLLFDLKSEREKRHISIDFRNPKNYQVTSEQTLCYVMVKNILENALRYSPENSTIVITMHEAKNTLKLTITDAGSGLSEMALSRAFDRFYRDNKQNISGSGLGLSIVKRISEITDIDVTLNNRTDASGLQVTLTFRDYCIINTT